MQNRQIVLIMTDTQRWDMVNRYRNTGLRTPVLDSLCDRGIRYDSAYTTQPVCQAARAGIFTGQFPHSVAGWSNCMGISDNVHTIGERLQDKGIHTAYIGKWHLDGGDYFGLGRCPKGWDPEYWFDMRNFLEELTEEERRISRRSEEMLKRDFPAEFTFAHKVSNRARTFLENHGKEKFFLTVSYDEPHGPSICPPPYSKMYRDYSFPKSPNIWDTLENKPQHQKVWAGDFVHSDKDSLEIHSDLFGCNSFVDEEIGRVVEAVEQYAPDALIIYTSDHGDFLASHSLYAKGPAAYDEITRIPLIICGKGIPQGVVDSNPVSHVDLAPTIMDLMGFPIPKVYEGHSLVSEIENPSHRTNDYIFMEFGRYEIDHDGLGGFQPMRTVFDGRYKMTINLLTSDELYDMENDPYEMVNLIGAKECIPIRTRLHKALLDHMNRTRDPFRGYYWENRYWNTDCRPPEWEYTRITRQREEEEYEPRQLDYDTGLPMITAVRDK